MTSVTVTIPLAAVAAIPRIEAYLDALATGTEPDALREILRAVARAAKDDPFLITLPGAASPRVTGPRVPSTHYAAMLAWEASADGQRWITHAAPIVSAYGGAEPVLALPRRWWRRRFAAYRRTPRAGGDGAKGA